MVDKGDVDAVLIKRDACASTALWSGQGVARVRLSQPSFARSVSPFSWAVDYRNGDRQGADAGPSAAPGGSFWLEQPLRLINSAALSVKMTLIVMVQTPNCDEAR